MMIKIREIEGMRLVSGKIEGDLTKEIAKRYFEEVARLATKEGLKRVLTDLRGACLLADENDMKELSQELARLGLACSYKRAVVVREDVRGYKQWENHCLSAGYREMRLFVCNDAATEWLAE